MLKKLLPVVLLLIGTGAGVGAGIFLRPAPAEPDVHAADAGPAPDGATEHSAADSHAEAEEDGDPEKEYAKLNNQFVVPVVKGDKVVALVVMSLSVEVPAGQKETVFAHEPKLRDSFLQILFDHANIGGFDGPFTDAKNLKNLRNALREGAQKDMGRDVIRDVLILEIARQDY